MTALQDAYIETMWTFMVAKGGASPREEYYASSIKASMPDTIQAHRHLKEHGIDLDRCTDPASHVAYGFNGTFTDSQLEIPYLKGTLWTKNDKHYEWAMSAPDGGDFGTMIRLLTGSRMTMEGAIETLGERIHDDNFGRFSHDKFFYLPDFS